jgi:hypothetical protein
MCTVADDQDHTVYRAYVLGPDGGILDAHVLECLNDDEALRRAERLARDNPIELWQQRRKIALIPIGRAEERARIRDHVRTVVSRLVGRQPALSRKSSPKHSVRLG